MEILNDGEKGNGRRRRKRAGGRRKESDKDRGGSEKEELGMEGGRYHSAPSPSLFPSGCCIYAPSLPMCPRSTQILLHQFTESTVPIHKHTVYFPGEETGVTSNNS